MDLTRRVTLYLRNHPHSSAATIASEFSKKLVGRGKGEIKSDVNKVLYHGMREGRYHRYQGEGKQPPLWRLNGVSEQAAKRALAKRNAARTAPPKFKVADRIPVPKNVRYPKEMPRADVELVECKKPYRWQKEALRAWRAKRRLGVIEAVTGTGKTMVGLIAAMEEVQQGGKVLVVVPTIELQTQWKRLFKAHLKGACVKLLGGGKKFTLGESDILISVVNSARTRKIKPPGGRGLLIADECHRYGSKMNSAALSPHFPRRLGLTATLVREDHGHIEWLKPYFWHEVFHVDYRRAKKDKIIAPFTVALVGVRLSQAGYKTYEKLTGEVSISQRKLIRDYGFPEKPFAEFMRRVNEVVRQGFWLPEARIAAKYLRAFKDRRKLLAGAKVKYDALERLAKSVRLAKRTIVFTETKAGATRAAGVLSQHGLRVGVVHSGVPSTERRETLKDFGDGIHQVIVAPKVLDEGIDVPAADLAIIVTASKSKRQMIQRMGRVIRPKVNGGNARFAILFIEDTSEDPADGAHEAFLEEIRDVAERERRFDSTSRSADVERFLRPSGGARQV